MAIRYYDEAVSKKISSWIKDKTMVILKPEEVTRLFQKLSYDKNDQPLTLPLIAISRKPEVTILNTTRKLLSYDGAKIRATNNAAQKLNAIPINIDYQLDIYTKTFEEGDEYLRNFIYNLINYPKLEIEIPYNNAGYDHMASIVLSESVTDNSDIPQRLFPGQFTRWTLNFNIPDAYLFSSPVKENVYIQSAEINSLNDNKNVTSDDKVTNEDNC